MTDDTNGGNGGKRYLADEKALKQDIVALKEKAEKHDEKIENLGKDVAVVSTKLSVIEAKTDDIKVVVDRTNESVIKMCAESNIMIKEFSEAKNKVAGIQPQIVTKTEMDWWRKAHFVVPVILGVLAILASLGISVGFNNTSKAASSDKDKIVVEQQEVLKVIQKMGKFLDRQGIQ